MNQYCPKSCGSCFGDNNNSKTKQSKDDVDPSCMDGHEQCEFWASVGECEKNPTYMLNHCVKSCAVCKPGNAARTATEQRLLDEVDSSILSKTTAFGNTQTADGDKKEITMKVVEEMLDYMEHSDDFKTLPDKIKKECKNRNELCSFWAAIGECEGEEKERVLAVNSIWTKKAGI